MNITACRSACGDTEASASQPISAIVTLDFFDTVWNGRNALIACLANLRFDQALPTTRIINRQHEPAAINASSLVNVTLASLQAQCVRAVIGHVESSNDARKSDIRF
jgi:hypothetical protein